MEIYEKRHKALSWWNELEYPKQLQYFKDYKFIEFTPATTPKQLTGREIEIIYCRVTKPGLGNWNDN